MTPQPSIAGPPDLHLTPGAISELKVLQRRAQATDLPLRVQVVGGGCNGFLYDLYFTDDGDADDLSLELDGLKLVIHPRSARVLQGVTIDFAETSHGKGFVFTNPAASSSCSCGASFDRGWRAR